LEEARQYSRNLGLKNKLEWRAFSKGELRAKGDKPDEIPTEPDKVYKSVGWISWGDWLGTGFIPTRLRKYRSFEEARDFVHGLRLNSINEWRKYCRGDLKGQPPLTKDIPANPYSVYKNAGWTTWGDWLGTGTVATYKIEYRPFEKAREFVRGLGLPNQRTWNLYCKGYLDGFDRKPDDIPANPERVYKTSGWKGLGDWLGTGRIANFQKTYRPFEDARRFARSLGLKNKEDWVKYCKKGTLPTDIPRNPSGSYLGRGWKRWGDWLGTDFVATRDREYREFAEAREFVRSLGLKSATEWFQYCKEGLPPDISTNPHRTYRGNGWISWGDWLGTQNVSSKSRKYRPFLEAQDFVRNLGLRTVSEWRAYCRGELSHLPPQPQDIPTDPVRVYKDKGWTSWMDWLGRQLNRKH